MTIANRLRPSDNVSPTFSSAIVSARPALQRHAMRLTKDHAAAEDLVQDTLTRAWRARTQFQGGTNLNAWLFRIARNAFLSGLRRTKRQVAWDPDRHPPMLVTTATQDAALYARDLQAAMSHLSQGQLEVLFLISHEGMSMADAADALGIPEGTVKSRVARARASLLAYVGCDNSSCKGPSVGGADSAVAVGEGSGTIDPTERAGRSRYEEWKASGATTIG